MQEAHVNIYIYIYLLMMDDVERKLQTKSNPSRVAPNPKDRLREQLRTGGSSRSSGDHGHMLASRGVDGVTIAATTASITAEGWMGGAPKTIARTPSPNPKTHIIHLPSLDPAVSNRRPPPGSIVDPPSS
jgi:hypothetical protein